MRCLACSEESNFWFEKVGPLGKYPLRRCVACKSAFVLPRPDVTQIQRMYHEPIEGGPEKLHKELHKIQPAVILDTDPTGYGLDNLPLDRSLPVDVYRIVSRLLSFSPGKSMLDVGAGNGLYTKGAVAAGFNVTALEPMAASRADFEFHNQFQAIDSCLDDQFARSHEGSYDAVLMSQVLEHLVDVEGAIQNCRRLLVGGGVLAIGVPHFRSWLSRLTGKRDMFICPPEHLNFFTLRGLQLLLKRHGFEVIFTETVTWFEPERIIKRLGSRVLGLPAVALLRIFFAMANRAHKGNTIEAYFRKK